jgi:hypothetical protein
MPPLPPIIRAHEPPYRALEAAEDENGAVQASTVVEGRGRTPNCRYAALRCVGAAYCSQSALKVAEEEPEPENEPKLYERGETKCTDVADVDVSLLELQEIGSFNVTQMNLIAKYDAALCCVVLRYAALVLRYAASLCMIL